MNIQEEIKRMRQMMGLSEQSKNPLGFLTDPNHMDYNKFNYNPKEKELNVNKDQPKNITIDWVDSFDDIQVKDREKNIFLYLTAKSCSICKILEKEFFNTQEFYDFIKTKNVNLVKIDIFKYKDIGEKFNTNSVPEVFLTDYNITFQKRLKTIENPFIYNEGRMPDLYTDVNKTIKVLDKEIK